MLWRRCHARRALRVSVAGGSPTADTTWTARVASFSLELLPPFSGRYEYEYPLLQIIRGLLHSFL